MGVEILTIAAMLAAIASTAGAAALVVAMIGMVAAPAKRHCSVCGRGPRTGHEATGSSERPNGERTCRHCHPADEAYLRNANGLDLFIAPQDIHRVEAVKIERVFIERTPRGLRELIRRAVELLDARSTLEAEGLHDSVRALDAEGPVHLQYLCRMMKVIYEAEDEFKDGQTALELDLDDVDSTARDGPNHDVV